MTLILKSCAIFVVKQLQVVFSYVSMYWFYFNIISDIIHARFCARNPEF